MTLTCRQILIGIVGTLTCTTLAAQSAVETVTVIGVAPLPAPGLSLDLVPANVQKATAEDLERLRALDLTEYLNRTATGIYINEAQGNPLQPDVQFRGFVASPLLGLPQGMAIYQDGVRINEPFGDTVNWALVPEIALASVTLTPGSSPVFGMNALGGALSLQTKNGFTSPGLHAEAQIGSFRRSDAQVEWGGQTGDGQDGIGVYVAASHFDEEGWRDFSPSRASQLFGDLRYQRAGVTLGLSVTHVDTNLIGNGPSPVQLLEQDREAIFTRPDQTGNELTMFNLNGTYRIDPDTLLSGVVYHRRSNVTSLNGDDSPFEECDADDDFLCEENGERLFDQNGAAVENDDDLNSATLNRSHTQQDSYGMALQLSYEQKLAGRQNHLTFGASADRSRVRFRSSTELGALDDTRQAIGDGVFANEAFVRLRAKSDMVAAYFTDTVELTSHLGLNVAGRYNVTDVDLSDQLGDDLNGSHRFSRFNPSVGLTWRQSASMQLYASIGEASRAPSPAELTCADEDDPCRLPNAFLSDPPLEQVVSRTVEAGARGLLGFAQWHAGVFRTVNHDDILFISSGALTNEGFFSNVGRTRRDGVELSLSGSVLQQSLAWFANYTWIDATFQEAFQVASANNPEAIDDEIPVGRGDRLPGVPRHLLKIGADYAATSRWSLGGDLQYASNQYLRGDEGNLAAPIAGHAVLNLRSTFAFDERLEMFVLLNNVFDRKYSTFGVFGAVDEVLGDDYDDPRFLSPGAPRAVWFGVKLGMSSR